MSKFHGMLLIDIADEPIGKWHENLGTRGMYDLWQIEGTGQFGDEEAVQSIIIQANEDSEKPEDEVIWQNELTGHWEYLDFGTYGHCLKSAKEFMRKNPNGIS